MARRNHKKLKLPSMPFEKPLPRLTRTTPPARLPQASFLNGTDALPTGISLLARLKELPDLREALLADTTITNGDRRPHRPRERGSYALLYAAMVADGYVHLRHFHKQHRDNPRVWELAGFEKRQRDGSWETWVPSRSQLYARFAELEQFASAFQNVAAILIQRADKHCHGLISRDIHVDGTQSQSHARMVHACRPGECRRPEQPHNPKSQTASADDVKADRERLAKAEETTDGDLAGDMKRWRDNHTTGQQEYKIGASPCWWTCADPDASARSYKARGRTYKTWIGFNNQKAVSSFVDAPIAVVDASARINEHLTYPETLEAIIANTGTRPRAIIGDLAYDTTSVRKHNGERGIATVTRQRSKLRPHTEIADGMGIPRCAGCGGEANVTRVEPLTIDETGKRKEARIWVTCTKPVTAHCKEKARYMREDWVGLNPLPPNTEAHQALVNSHMDYENVHHLWRNRHGVAGDNPATRLKRTGLGAQRLRSQAALFVEWLRISTREGWLGSPRSNRRQPYFLDGIGYLQDLRNRRRVLGLSTPYGESAVEHGLGPLKPAPLIDAADAPAATSGAPPGD